jgi:hypothetical protein
MMLSEEEHALFDDVVSKLFPRELHKLVKAFHRSVPLPPGLPSTDPTQVRSSVWFFF